MSDASIKSRTTFVISLLNNLKDIYEELKELSSDIENCSESFYENLFKSSRVEVENDIENYKNNIQKMKQLNINVTTKINEWYSFIKDTNEIRKVTFPIKLYFRKKAFKKTIDKMNSEILDLSVENRFIREKIINWEQELSVRALQEMKKGDEFSKYEELNRKKDHLVSELTYLLATIPDLESAEFDMNNIDTIIDKLLKIAAA
ncbi:MAG: hypothetical protein GX660_20815 [Clostridiaceae bacterium]|nr:hypothetical protein [Clostridiaceae bacterium]